MITTILKQPLAITREALDGIVNAVVPDAILKTRGEKVEGSSLEVRDKTGIINIKGPIFRATSFLYYFIDIVDSQSIATNFQAALDNDDVESILLNIDSPGGTVTGISELAGFIHESRGLKPVIAYIAGQGASAAYWIAAAADQIIISDTGMAGSIGVVATTYKKDDDSIEIVSSVSPKKRPDAGTEEGLNQYQKMVDDTAEVFVGAVAKYRGVSEDTVKKNYGQGDSLVGKYAVAAGLADKVGTLEGAIREFKTNKKFLGGLSMKFETVEQLTTEYPVLVKAIQDTAASGVEVQPKVDAEKERILGLAKAMGIDNLEALVNSGVTVEQYHAIQGTIKPAVHPSAPAPEAKPEKNQEMLDALKASGAGNPGSGAGVPSAPKDFDTAVNIMMESEKITRGAAIKKVALESPELHEKYLDGLR